MNGVFDRAVASTPIAILDFETTGLTPGYDRVVEVSVLRVEPGKPPRLALDTLINPLRPMAATEIHGITDDDVADAPRFCDIAGDLVQALSDCVVAAYNVYFDVKFLNFELENSGVRYEPPHLCLMYLRPMLGMGSKCRLEVACSDHGIKYASAHIAANDVQACGALLLLYLDQMRSKGIRTFQELGRLKSYKFVSSFGNAPLPACTELSLTVSNRRRSRLTVEQVMPQPVEKNLIAVYWDAICTVVADLEITDEEVDQIVRERRRLGLDAAEVKAMHARAFGSAIAQFTHDQWLDDREVGKLRRLHKCLGRLGWAPGE